MQLPHATLQILSDAVQAELRVSHLYKHIANQMQRIGYFGAAKWFKQESKDELKHYQLHADYLNDRGGVATLPAIEAFDDTITDLKAAIVRAKTEEESLGDKYAKWFSTLVTADPMTAQFLLQFLEIQRVSAGEYGDWLSRITLANGDPAALLQIDRELGE
jgi:ferritin